MTHVILHRDGGPYRLDTGPDGTVTAAVHRGLGVWEIVATADDVDALRALLNTRTAVAS